MTSAVDWALKANHVSISIFAGVTDSSDRSDGHSLVQSIAHFFVPWPQPTGIKSAIACDYVIQSMAEPAQTGFGAIGIKIK